MTHIEFVPTQVNMLKRATDLAPTNVGGTAAVLSFAALAGAPVVFTSTVLPLEGAVPTGYRQSKGAAGPAARAPVHAAQREAALRTFRPR